VSGPWFHGQARLEIANRQKIAAVIPAGNFLLFALLDHMLLKARATAAGHERLKNSARSKHRGAAYADFSKGGCVFQTLLKRPVVSRRRTASSTTV
jgi:hypothetical protein